MSYTFSFYNSHSLEIKDLQPWTKCSHNSDDIQHMAILFSRRSDEWQIWGYTVTFQFRDFLYTPLLCWTHWINIFAMWVKYQFGSRCTMHYGDVGWVSRRECQRRYLLHLQKVVTSSIEILATKSVSSFCAKLSSLFPLSSPSPQTCLAWQRSLLGVSDLSRHVGLVYICLLLKYVNQLLLGNDGQGKKDQQRCHRVGTMVNLHWWCIM